MAEQQWFPGDLSSSRTPLSAPSSNGFSSAPPPLPSPSRSPYELRPLSTGELLDRTFHLYRANFWLFVGLSAIAAAVNTIAGLVQLAYLHFVGSPHGGIFNPAAGAQTPRSMLHNLIISGIAVISSILYLAVYTVTQAATTSAVTSLYLGNDTSMPRALNAVKGHWFRFILIGLWQIWSAIWAVSVLLILIAILMAGIVAVFSRNAAGAATPILMGALLFVAILAGFVYGVIAYIRNSFAVPASVMEGLKVRKSMRRSKQLTSGTKGRVFLLFLFIAVLYVVAIAIASPMAFLVLQNKTNYLLLLQALNLFLGFVTGSVIGPVGAIGLCLFYIDQRIRREGFDIEFLLERSGPASLLEYPAMASTPTA